MAEPAMRNLDSILKGRDITLLIKVHLVKAVVFLVVKYGCDSWTIKKAQHQRTDAFELWCWRRLLTVVTVAHLSKLKLCCWSSNSLPPASSPEGSFTGDELASGTVILGGGRWG